MRDFAPLAEGVDRGGADAEPSCYLGDVEQTFGKIGSRGQGGDKARVACVVTGWNEWIGWMADPWNVQRLRSRASQSYPLPTAPILLGRRGSESSKSSRPDF